MSLIKSLDVDVVSHKEYLRRLIESIKQDDPKAGKNYESFINKLLIYFSDNPPTSWRFAGISDRFPRFRVFNRRTENLNDFIGVPIW